MITRYDAQLSLRIDAVANAIAAANELPPCWWRAAILWLLRWQLRRYERRIPR